MGKQITFTFFKFFLSHPGEGNLVCKNGRAQGKVLLIFLPKEPKIASN